MLHPNGAVPSMRLLELPLGLPPVLLNEVDGALLVLVPGGTFVMGPAQHGAASPAHPVTLPAFYLSVFAVSERQFRRHLEATGQTRALARRAGRGDASGDTPAVNVTWREAADYAGWAGGRLPSEAEWEYAIRGPAGLAPAEGASPFGAMPLAGGVIEWCADWYAERYYCDSPATAPAGPAQGDRRVLRGGRLPGAATRRCSEPPEDASADIGFRFVRPLPALMQETA